MHCVSVVSMVLTLGDTSIDCLERPDPATCRLLPGRRESLEKSRYHKDRVGETMDRRFQLAASVVLSAWLLSSCSAVSTPNTSADASSSLRELLEASDEAKPDRNPIYGIFRGDLRRAARFGDYTSEAYVAAEKNAAANELQELAAIPRERLTTTERIAYDTFRWSRADALERNSPPASLIWPRLKLDQQNGWHVFFPEFSSGDGIAPYRTVQDYENGLVRIDGFVEYVDRAVGRMREGIPAGVVQPRFVVDRLIVQFERFNAQGPDTSPYCGPVRTMPTDMVPADRERFTKAYVVALETKLRPAFRRVHAFLIDEYRPAARESVGLSAIYGRRNLLRAPDPVAHNDAAVCSTDP